VESEESEPQADGHAIVAEAIGFDASS